MKRIFLFVLFAFAFASCKTNSDDDKGSLVISNRQDNSNIQISAVYVMQQGTNGYNLVYSGSIPALKSHFIELKPGNYSVKIATSTNLADIFSAVRYYDTGYNIYKPVREGGFVNVAFDGSGIYFE